MSVVQELPKTIKKGPDIQENESYLVKSKLLLNSGCFFGTIGIKPP